MTAFNGTSRRLDRITLLGVIVLSGLVATAIGIGLRDMNEIRQSNAEVLLSTQRVFDALQRGRWDLSMPDGTKGVIQYVPGSEK